MTKKKNGKELVVVAPTDYAAVKMEVDITEVIRTNLGNVKISPLDLDQIKIPAAGGRVWSYETLDGEVDSKIIEGIIVYTTTTRVYWKDSYEESGGGSPPDCVSIDMIHGRGEPGGMCPQCPLSEFKSAPVRKGQEKSRGQACQERRFMFLVLPNAALPYVINLPPTSLNPSKRFLLRLASNGINFYERITRVELEPDKSADGHKFSKAKFSVAGPVPNPDFWKEYSLKIAPMLQATAEEIATEMEQDHPETE